MDFKERNALNKKKARTGFVFWSPLKRGVYKVAKHGKPKITKEDYDNRK
jgi:hypothetical protein